MTGRDLSYSPVVCTWTFTQLSEGWGTVHPQNTTLGLRQKGAGRAGQERGAGEDLERSPPLFLDFGLPFKKMKGLHSAQPGKTWILGSSWGMHKLSRKMLRQLLVHFASRNEHHLPLVRTFSIHVSSQGMAIGALSARRKRVQCLNS